MKLSISRSRESIWVWLFWGLGIYLALELGPFIMAAQALNKTAGELAGPYLAFAAPAVIVMPLVWWLKKREEHGASPKRLARAWGLITALFIVAVTVALFYSGVELRLMDASRAFGGFVAAALWGAFIVYFSAYRTALRQISARVAEKAGGPGAKESDSNH